MKLADAALLRQQVLIAGHWQDAADGARITVRNPACDALVGHVPHCTEDDIAGAVEAAHAAFAGWRAQPAKSRAEFLRRWFDLILQHRDDLAVIMVSEQGKPLAEARARV